MDDAIAPTVRGGSWTNRISGRWLWLISSQNAGISVQFLGILLTLALPRIWVGALTLYRRGVSRKAQASQAAAVDVDHTRDPVPDPGEYALERLWNAGLPRNRLPTEILPPRDRQTFVSDIIVVIFSALVFSLVIVSGTLTNLLSSDSLALARSPNCGLPKFNKDSPLDVKIQSMQWSKRGQEDAAIYAEDCYAASGSAFDKCNLFARKDLPYIVEDPVPCPFGFLGFNTGRGLQFMRTTTCAPLVMNDSFLEYKTPVDDKDPYGYEWRYHYGGRGSLSPYTITFPVQAYTQIDQNYAVTLVSSVGSGYQPMPDLQPHQNSTISIFFIDVSHVTMLDEVLDPIFEARHPYYNPLMNLTTWSSNTLRTTAPRVLACVDGIALKNTRSGQEWMYTAEAPTSASPTERQEWDLLHWLLSRTHTYQATYLRNGPALNASSKLGLWLSLPLGPDQWKIEALHWFEASLAGMQFEVRRIALGLYAGVPGYDQTDASMRLCTHLFLVNAPGYSNVFAGPWLAIFLCSCRVILVTFPSGAREQGKLVFEYLPATLLDRADVQCVAVVDGVITGFEWISKHLILRKSNTYGIASSWTIAIRDYCRPLVQKPWVLLPTTNQVIQQIGGWLARQRRDFDALFARRRRPATG